MFRKIWTRKGVSYRDASQRLRPSLDPLAFLNADGGGITTQDALDQLHSAIHSSLEDVQKAFQLVFEQLNPEANVSDRIILDANKQIRTQQTRARNLVTLRQEELNRQVRVKLENLFIQGIVQSPHQEPAVRIWENLSSRIVHRNEPEVSEYSYEDLGNAEKRGRRIAVWDHETDEWLETLCQNNIHEIITRMEEMIKDYKETWVEVTGELRKRANLGGLLFQQVNDPDVWNFESEDPTVTNLLEGSKALDIANRILERFQLVNQDILEVADTVRMSLDPVPVFGTNRVALNELEELLALAIAEKLRDTIAVEAGFLSLISNGMRFGEELGELLDDMRRGAAAMEEKLWRIGEVGVGHVDSAAGVGITSPSVHDFVLRGLGGGRKFAAVEGHPGNNHRFDVQMSIVGAPASDLTIFREMVYAWYSWHFEEERGAAETEQEWMNIVMADCWKLYPDIGKDTGVRNAIVELIDDDIRILTRGREQLPTRTANGLPSELDLLQGLWSELGISDPPPKGKASKSSNGPVIKEPESQEPTESRER